MLSSLSISIIHKVISKSPKQISIYGIHSWWVEYALHVHDLNFIINEFSVEWIKETVPYARSKSWNAQKGLDGSWLNQEKSRCLSPEFPQMVLADRVGLKLIEQIRDKRIKFTRFGSFVMKSGRKQPESHLGLLNSLILVASLSKPAK